MRADLVAAIRSLRSTPTFTTVALVVLALGIGATTAIFSVVDAVVLRGLPFDEHDRLVAIGERRPPDSLVDPTRDPSTLTSVAPQNYLDWVEEQQVFDRIAAIAGGSFTLHEAGDEPEDLRGQRVTTAFFDVLHVAPALGRAFTPEDETAGRDRVVVLSDSLWQRRFGGDSAILGRTIPLEGAGYEVIGVLPPDVTYPVGAARLTDVYVPYVVPNEQRIRRIGRREHYLQVIGRLRTGATVEQAQAQMDQVAAALTAANPEWNKGSLIGVRPLRDHIVGGRTRSWMLMLLTAVGIVLLIACANLANLMLARASAREREIGVRAALGAGRWRLVRQMLVESLVLAAAGTAIAVLLAFWFVQVLRNAMPDGVARVSAIALDLRVLAAAAAVALVTGILFGLFPALQLSKPDLTRALKDGARGTTGAGRQRLRNALVVAEVALAVVLLVGAALFISSFAALMRIDPGFDPANVLTVQVYPRTTPGQPPGDHRPAFTRIVERIGQAPGVLHAGAIWGGMPFGGSMSTTALTVPGVARGEGENVVSVRRVTPGYHQALRIPLRSGRLFEPSDREGAARVVIVNEAIVKAFFNGQDPVGRSVTMQDAEWTIAGVVGDVHQSSLEAGPLAEVYVPLTQGGPGAGELVIRTSGGPYAVLPAVRSAVLQELPEVPLRNVRSLDEVLARRVAQRRLNMLLLGLFGLLGLVIAAVGIYGVMAYVVSQRTKEIGVRMALGASRSAVVGMVLRSACVLVAIGLAVGGLGAWYLSATAEAFLFRTEATDPRAFAAALAVLSIAALVASAIPARRAASVDPMVALRAE
jgi:putative ABC transport system permease protein